MIPFCLSELLPEPVALDLAGQEYRVGPLRLRDLAALERWLALAAPDPLRDLPPREADPAPATRRRRLAAARDAAASWPPRLGTPAAAELLETGRGAVAYLWILLSRHQDLTVARARDLAGRLTAAEWAALDRIAWGEPPLEAILREVDPEAFGGDPEAAPRDWGETIDRLARERGWTYAEVGELTLAQLACAERHGRPRQPGGAIASAEDLAEHLERHRRRWGDAADGPPPADESAPPTEDPTP